MLFTRINVREPPVRQARSLTRTSSLSFRSPSLSARKMTNTVMILVKLAGSMVRSGSWAPIIQPLPCSMSSHDLAATSGGAAGERPAPGMVSAGAAVMAAVKNKNAVKKIRDNCMARAGQ